MSGKIDPELRRELIALIGAWRGTADEFSGRTTVEDATAFDILTEAAKELEELIFDFEDGE